jgi:hypothetical protein
MTADKRLLISMAGGVVASGIYCAIHNPETIPFAFPMVLIALPSLFVLLLAEYRFPQRPILCTLLYLASIIPFTAGMLYVWLVSDLSEGRPMAKFALQNYVITIIAMSVCLHLFRKQAS